MIPALKWHMVDGCSVSGAYKIKPVPKGFHLLIDGNECREDGDPILFHLPSTAAIRAQRIEDDEADNATAIQWAK